MSSSGFYPDRDYFRYRRLEELLRGPEGERIRSLDDVMHRAEPVTTVTVLTINSSSLYRIGSIATDTDREFRRAAAIIGQGPEGRHDYDFGGDSGLRPRPIHPVYGGLLVRDASPGSLHLLVELYGEVQTLMLSRPVSTLVSVVTLGGTFVSLRAWLNRRKAADSGERPRDALTEARRDVGRMLQEKPDQQLDFHPPEEDEGLVVSEEDMEGPVEPPPVPHVGPPPVTYVSEIEADEFYVRGREITPIRNYPDGTQDIIYVRS